MGKGRARARTQSKTRGRRRQITGRQKDWNGAWRMERGTYYPG